MTTTYTVELDVCNDGDDLQGESPAEHGTRVRIAAGGGHITATWLQPEGPSGWPLWRFTGRRSDLALFLFHWYQGEEADVTAAEAEAWLAEHTDIGPDEWMEDPK